MVLGNIDKAVLDSIYREDPLAFAIANVDLLDGKSWQLNDRKWLVEPFLAANPYLIEKHPADTPRKVAVEKSTQAGISTLSIAKALHFMSFWPVRVGYMLPRQQDISVFSMTRLDPILRNSPFLMSKLGQPDSTYIKRLGSSFLYFLEGSVEPRSIPIDMLLLDEVDLCNPDHVGTAINRMDASNWKTTIWLSTPTLPASGIDAIYESSDKRQWLVPCPHCGAWQHLDWEQNLRVVGAANDPTEVYYACAKCGKELTLADIQEGRWVAQHPNKSGEVLGYHISQMMTLPARELYGHFRDPNQSLSEFYRKRLGKPYTVSGGSIEREDFLISCFPEPYWAEAQHDGESTYYMGVDQGNQLQVVVAKLVKGQRFPKVVHIELVPFEQGFDRVGQLMRLFNVRRCVIDGDPNRHPIRDLQTTYPGRVLMADYIEQRERFTKKISSEKGPLYNLPVAVTINRTEAFDDLMQSIKDGLWRLPGDPSHLPTEVELLIDQVTALRRDIEKRKTQSGEVEVGVWRKLRADHLGHSMVYLKTAMDIDKLAEFRMAVIGGRKVVGAEKKTVEEDPTKPDPDSLVEITAQLAEVPMEQIIAFLERNGTEGYQIPFPLNVKLDRVAAFPPEQVLWVMGYMKRLSVR